MAAKIIGRLITTSPMPKKNRKSATASFTLGTSPPDQRPVFQGTFYQFSVSTLKKE
jgi:hypothetical protein